MSQLRILLRNEVLRNMKQSEVPEQFQVELNTDLDTQRPQEAPDLSERPTTSNTSSAAGGSWIGSTTDDLGTQLASLFQAEQEAFEREIACDPQAWVRARARRLLQLFPEGLSVEELLAETRAHWIGVAERLRQCDVCPVTGGACARDAGDELPASASAVAEGYLTLREKHAVKLEPCPRFAKYKQRQLVRSIGVPPQLLDVHLPSLLATATPALRDAVTSYISDLPNLDHPWLVVSGGTPMQRTRLTVSITSAVLIRYLRRTAYEFTPRLFKDLLDHMNKRIDTDPKERIEASWFFALDYVDPTRWTPWFLSEMDMLFFGRWGRPFVMSTPRPITQLSEAFEQAGMCFDGAMVVDAAGVGR